MTSDEFDDIGRRTKTIKAIYQYFYPYGDSPNDLHMNRNVDETLGKIVAGGGYGSFYLEYTNYMSYYINRDFVGLPNKELLDVGAITQEEFDAKKQELLKS